MSADPTDATELLVVQHRRLEALLAALLQAHGTAARRQALDAASHALALHWLAEEHVFYPAVRRARTTGTWRAPLGEHGNLKRLLRELMALSPDDARYEARCRVLNEQAVQHHGEEEEHLFPAVHLLFDAPRREALGRGMLQLQTDLSGAGDPRHLGLGETDTAEPLVR